ncbi:MAG TPA: hypothetical protein VIM65_07765, partial [Cyclobacteriaceae bacterium]
MMNLSTYKALVDSIGLSKLNEANKDTYNIVKEGSDNFNDSALWNEMLTDADIKEAYELHIKALEKMAKAESKPANVKVAKERPAKKIEVKKVATKKVVEKKVAKKLVTKKRVVKRKTSPSKRKTKRKAVKKSVKKEEVKFPVTVKRLSKELQLIKRMASWDGKRKTVTAVGLFHRDVQKLLKSNPDRKPILKEISKRLGGALTKAEAAGVKELDITLDAHFKSKLKENVSHPKPKMKVEYLAGLESGRKKKVDADVIPDYREEYPVEIKRSSPGESLSGVDDVLFSNIDNIDTSVKDSFRLKGDLGVFFGDLERYKVAISVEGDQGAGKTQLAFQIANAFAEIGDTVGMFLLETGAKSNIVIRNREKYIAPANRARVSTAGEAPKGIETVRDYARRFKVVIIDSWTKLDVDSSEFDKLRNDFPDTVWVVLFQRTSSNKIRGGTKP